MTKEELKNKLLGFAASVAESNGTCISDIVDFWSEYIYKELPHWISVEDELPKEHEWILGFSLKRSYIDVYNFDSNGLIEAHDITHWMPMPTPPKP